MDFKPTTHEPCLYSGTYKVKNIYFPQQVDDFSIVCEDKSISKAIINDVNSQMSDDIKYLGLFSRFNGVNILQTDEYIKMSGTTYIKKICKEYKAWMTPQHFHTLPAPMRSEYSYNRELETVTPPSMDK